MYFKLVPKIMVAQKVMSTYVMALALALSYVVCIYVSAQQ